MTASELFDTKVPTLFAQHPDKVPRVGMVYCFKLTGPGGGTWTVDLASPTPTCKPGDGGQARCTIEVAYSDFQNILLQPNLGMQLYFQGKLKVSGDMMAVTKLQPLFALIA